MQKNLATRKAAERNGVKLWEIGYTLGMSETHFSRKLRKEFSADETRLVLEIIDRIVKERDAE